MKIKRRINTSRLFGKAVIDPMLGEVKQLTAIAGKTALLIGRAYQIKTRIEPVDTNRGFEIFEFEF